MVGRILRVYGAFTQLMPGPLLLHPPKRSSELCLTLFPQQVTFVMVQINIVLIYHSNMANYIIIVYY